MVREGSVGLFVLGGIALFIGLTLWLKEAAFGQDSYSFIVLFDDASGIQSGANVRYRGVEVGNVTAIEAGANGVEVNVEIADTNLLLPNQVLVAANQSGLITETVLDITPLEPLPEGTDLPSPTADNCDSNIILCEGDRVEGDIGISFNQMISSTVTLAEVYGDPAFVQGLTTTLAQAGLAANEVAELTQDLSLLSQTLQKEVQGFSTTTQAITNAANTTSREISQAANQLTQTAQTTSTQINQLSNTAQTTANQVSQLANTAGVTATQFSELATNLNSLVVQNRGNLVTTLNNLTTTSEQLSVLLTDLTPTLEKVNTTFETANTEQLVQNLQTLTANAAEASANLRDISSTLNDPTNLVLLQQTLDSARVTFANTQKITSDLDELTGNPEFRRNLLRLVNGLSVLVSSTEQLEEQVYNAQVLEPMNKMVNNPNLTPQALNAAAPASPDISAFQGQKRKRGTVIRNNNQ